MIDAAWDYTYRGQRLGEAVTKYTPAQFRLRLAALDENTMFVRMVRIRTESDPEKIADFSLAEKEIYYDWRKRTMTEEERKKESLKNAEKMIALLKK